MAGLVDARLRSGFPLPVRLPPDRFIYGVSCKFCCSPAHPWATGFIWLVGMLLCLTVDIILTCSSVASVPVRALFKLLSRALPIFLFPVCFHPTCRYARVPLTVVASSPLTSLFTVSQRGLLRKRVAAYNSLISGWRYVRHARLISAIHFGVLFTLYRRGFVAPCITAAGLVVSASAHPQPACSEPSLTFVLLSPGDLLLGSEAGSFLLGVGVGGPLLSPSVSRSSSFGFSPRMRPHALTSALALLLLPVWPDSARLFDFLTAAAVCVFFRIRVFWCSRQVRLPSALRNWLGFCLLTLPS